MDLNDRIAARRAELARGEAEAKAAERAAAARQQAAEARQREAAAQALTDEINAAGDLEASREGQEVVVAPELDLTGYAPDMKRAALQRLFRREARKHVQAIADRLKLLCGELGQAQPDVYA